MYMLVTVSALILNYFPNFGNGYCMRGPLQSEITEVTKRIRQFCEYKTPGSGSVVRLFPGSVIYTSDCLECSCSLRGLSCCGFGSHAGTVGLPDDCTKLEDGCQDIYVKKSNNSLDCFSGKPIDFQSMAFKPHTDSFIGIHKASKDGARSNTDTLQSATTGQAMFLPSIEIPKQLQIPNARTWNHLVSGRELTKLNRPLPVSEILHELMTKHQSPRNSLRSITNNEVVPSVENKLNHPVPVREILQELLTKYLPAGNSLRTNANAETAPAKSTKAVETSGMVLPHTWHAPMPVHPYSVAPNPAPWLPWLFVDHI